MTARPSLVRLVLAELEDDPQARDELRALLQAADDERWLTTREAADRLRLHPETVARYAKQGRVRGAERVASNRWRFRAGLLELMPADPAPLGSAGPGRGRRPGPSSAAASIRAAAQRPAA